ncbi:DUF3685 domain-containing protein [Cephalotus follicularis]|uniref:DUF3685 domain-containing protein n=1 Tax=Cephalotus follicularis TaxID=3775 RepID=A0A1Q3BS15_CEPFO|nr:DUF3685 domain-containing protein [Cephalotus follicularis]
MAECAASPSCIKLRATRSCVKEKGYALRNSLLNIAQRKYFHGICKAVQLSTWKMCELSSPAVLNLKVHPDRRVISSRCSCLGSLVNPDGATISDWVPLADQVLLMASMFLTYVAGVVPIQKSNFSSPKTLSDDDVNAERSTSSGSAWNNTDQVNLKYAWDVAKRKLLDSLDAIERRSNWGSRVLEPEQHHPKRPLSLYALSEGPKLRLLWASLQQLEEKVNSILSNSDIVNMDDWLTGFSEIIQKSCQPVCKAWLESELDLENSNLDMALVSLLIEKLKGNDTVLQNIRKSGKEDLYAELLYFLRYGALRKGCCYDHNLFIMHGGSILEDLVITLADGIASNFLELISVDGSLSNEMSSLDLDICNLSTRALQRLRNDVALNQWMYQNLEAVISMYEDRFDLCILQSQLIVEPSKDQVENCNWWEKLTMRKSTTLSSPFRNVVISYFSMPVKRTKELRALTGWRYYFSIFLELSDISMPLIRAVFDKITNAISFFLVCLIGRSLGLIYTGIRQSLRWK